MFDLKGVAIMSCESGPSGTQKELVLRVHDIIDSIGLSSDYPLSREGVTAVFDEMISRGYSDEEIEELARIMDLIC